MAETTPTPVVPSVKPGVRTTQFWLTLLLQLVCYLIAAAQAVLPLLHADHPEFTWVNGLISVVAVVAALVAKVHYDNNRTNLYGAVIQAVAQIAQMTSFGKGVAAGIGASTIGAAGGPVAGPAPALAVVPPKPAG